MLCELYGYCADRLVQLHDGQGMDIYWRDTVTCPTEKEYRRMVQQKTGGLFGLGVDLMMLFSEQRVYSPTTFTNLIDLLALLFQIRY